VIRFLLVVGAIVAATVAEPIVAFAQHAQPARPAPYVSEFHGTPPSLHAAEPLFPRPAAPAPRVPSLPLLRPVTPPSHVDLHPIPIYAPFKHVEASTPDAESLAFPNQYPGRGWGWNNPYFVSQPYPFWQPSPFCWAGTAWGEWGMSSTPQTFGDLTSDQAPAFYSSYEFGPWGPGAQWLPAYGVGQGCGAFGYGYF
jgi:hypothetical protein